MTILTDSLNRIQHNVPSLWPLDNFWLHWGVFTVIILVFVLGLVLAFTLYERKALGRIQSRYGPNRAGPFGILQPFADGIKALLKEDIVPVKADKILHFMAPLVALVPVLVVFTVVPFADNAQMADLNVGILFIMAVSAISVMGIFMAGWGSNNKYSLLGAMRAVASVVSYEIPVVLSLVGVVLIAGSLSLNDIILAQNIPFILYQPLGFLLFFIGALAEINRSPFDFLEADSEIVAGFHTEYSGMKFALFYLVEYAEALLLSALVSILFLSGWKGPFLPPWLWLLIKIMIVFFVLIWVRSTVPRARIDQLMALAWKFLFPLALINLFITGIEVLVWPSGLPWYLIIVNFAIAIVLVLAFSKLFKVGWGRVEIRTLR